MTFKPYLNFDLLLTEEADQYLVRLIDSPAGQASHHFTLPFSLIELENFILKTGQNRGNVRSLHLEAIDFQSIEKLGGDLYNCLFDGKVAESLRTSQAIARREKKGLRIRLRLSAVPTLINIPWELLFDTEKNNYVGLSVNSPIIRKLDLTTSPRIDPVQDTVKILIMIANPSDNHFLPLEVEEEWKKINIATGELQNDGRVTLTRVEPSLPALQRQLRLDSYHVFHYIGHGGFDSSLNDGLLILQDSEGKSHKVSGQYLGSILYDHHSIKLALLNSCSGGRTSVTDPFAGLAQSLLQKDIPAVIAMQFEITDKAAITFSQEFYNAIADGYPIDAAVAEARKMIYAQENQLEWATPVLYTSIDGGVLLEKRRLKQPKKELNQALTLDVSKQEDEVIENPSPPKYFSIIILALLVALTGFAVYKSTGPNDPENTSVSVPTPPKTEASADSQAPTENPPKIPQPKMISIPAGEFLMGCDKSRDTKDGKCESDQLPPHKVSVDAFKIGKYEVTFNQWDACEKAKVCPPADDYGWGRGNHPVFNVTWNDVTQKFIPWLNKQTNQQFRLPTEAEWEYVARDGGSSVFPWGDSISCDDTHFDYETCKSEDQPLEVGLYPVSRFGVHDIAGNVRELLQDCWTDNYDNASSTASTNNDCDGNTKRATRGGSWAGDANQARSVNRGYFSPDEKRSHTGFRLAQKEVQPNVVTKLAKVAFTIDHIHDGNHLVMSTYDQVKNLVEKNIPVTVFLQATDLSGGYRNDKTNAKKVYDISPELVTLGIHTLPRTASEKQQTENINTLREIIQDITGTPPSVLSYHGPGAASDPNINLQLQDIRFARGIMSVWASGSGNPLDTPVMTLRSVSRAFDSINERHRAGLSSTLFVHSTELVRGSTKKAIFDALVEAVLQGKLQAVSYLKAMQNDFGESDTETDTGKQTLQLSAVTKGDRKPVNVNFHIKNIDNGKEYEAKNTSTKIFAIPFGKYKITATVGNTKVSSVTSIGSSGARHHLFLMP